MPSLRAKVSGVNAATAGVPSPPRDSSLGEDVEGGAARGGDAGVSGGGVQDRPLVGQSELHQRGAAFGLFGLGGGFEDTGGVEVLDLELLRRVPRSWDYSNSDHRQSSGSEPLLHKGF